MPRPRWMCRVLDRGVGGGKADDASDPDAATRDAILAAIHGGYLDGNVHGQPAELDVSTFGVSGSFAWVTATVGAPGGGDLDWENSEFADELAEGLFDGPALQALLLFEDGDWSVLEAAVGSTDVWWDGIWYRYAVSCSLFPGTSCPSVRVPASGTATRTALMRTIHAELDPAVQHQPNELVVSWARVGGNFAYVSARVQAIGGGELDWTRSDYADEIETGLWDGPQLSAFMEETSTGWTMREMAVGATDVPWFGAWTRYADVPCAVFPINACPAE